MSSALALLVALCVLTSALSETIVDRCALRGLLKVLIKPEGPPIFAFDKSDPSFDRAVPSGGADQYGEPRPFDRPGPGSFGTYGSFRGRGPSGGQGQFGRRKPCGKYGPFRGPRPIGGSRPGYIGRSMPFVPPPPIVAAMPYAPPPPVVPAGPVVPLLQFVPPELLGASESFGGPGQMGGTGTMEETWPMEGTGPAEETWPMEGPEKMEGDGTMEENWPMEGPGSFERTGPTEEFGQMEETGKMWGAGPMGGAGKIEQPEAYEGWRKRRSPEFPPGPIQQDLEYQKRKLAIVVCELEMLLSYKEDMGEMKRPKPSTVYKRSADDPAPPPASSFDQSAFLLPLINLVSEGDSKKQSDEEVSPELDESAVPPVPPVYSDWFEQDPTGPENEPNGNDREAGRIKTVMEMCNGLFTYASKYCQSRGDDPEEFFQKCNDPSPPEGSTPI